MGILSDMWERRANALSLLEPGAWSLGANSGAAGVRVTTSTALQSTAVFACVRVLAESVASLPLVVYQRRADGGKERAEGHPLYSLLHDRVNPLMTSFEFREMAMGHLALWGNHYSEIEYNGAGLPVALWPLRPDRMEIIRTKDDRLIYHYQLPSGRYTDLPAETVLHIRGLGSDGVLGHSPIGVAKNAVGLTLATEEFGARFFGNDARPGTVLSHPGVLGDEAAKRLSESWTSAYGSLSKSHRVAILEEGMSIEAIGVPPEHAQFLETRKFQVSEIARLFRVPPHMLADLERATFSNIEQQSIDFVQHTLRPWLVRWEQRLNTQIVTDDGIFAEFVIDGLLRGDAEARSQFYTSMFNIGAMSPNDIRAKENMNPVPGGDDYFVQLNMVPVDQAADGPELEPVRSLPTEQRTEQRARKAATMRRRLQQTHVRTFADAVGRILRREANDVGNAARKLLENRSLAEFDQWLRDFYEEHQAFTREQMAPVATAYMELVANQALEEVGGDIDEERVQRFIQSYLYGFASRHTTRQEQRIRQILTDIDPTTGEPAILERIENEVESWRDEDRARFIAQDETVRSGNAVAVTAYVLAGVTILRWASLGESCPYCTALDGRTVSITEVFIPAGSDFEPDGADRPLTTTVNIGHPPAHGGCDCVAVAG